MSLCEALFSTEIGFVTTRFHFACGNPPSLMAVWNGQRATLLCARRLIETIDWGIASTLGVESPVLDSAPQEISQILTR